MSTATASNFRVEITNRQILQIALPISLAILVPQINFVTNNIFLGHLDEKLVPNGGEQSLATAGITGVFYLIFAVTGQGLNNGLQALIARRAGENKIEEIGKLFAQSILISLALALLCILFTYFFAPWILQFSLKSPEVKNQAVSFLRIRIWGLPFLFIYQMRNALLVGTNQSKYLIYGTLAETIVNIALDYGLIFGHFGLPGIGFNGAAYASICAEAAGMFVVFAVIHIKGISRQLQLFKSFSFDAKNTWLILAQSSPLIFQYVISVGSWEFFYIMVEHHGKRDLAISNTMRNIFGMFGVFTWAFAATTNTMVSNIIGQGKKEKVIELIMKIIKLSLCFSLAMAAALNIFPNAFIALFGQNADFALASLPVIRVVSVALIMMSVSTVWLNAVTGTGNTSINLAIEVFTIVFYCIYVYLVLGYFNLSIIYGWMSEYVYWISTFVLAFLYLKSGKWKKKVI
ncbi:MAG: MATE family efflux transporter [Bacteroidetes bacterium]|nr:MATE family efflux transporter [Bacteroidota bacterium]MBS1974545.1 MATE family efflux transporter [Bacteroidota bacterium]